MSSKVTAALAASISTLGQAATVLLMGFLGDRLGRRRVLIAALLLAMVGDGIALSAPSAALSSGVLRQAKGTPSKAIEVMANSYASGLTGTMLVVALLVALLGVISLLLLVIGRQQGSPAAGQASPS